MEMSAIAVQLLAALLEQATGQQVRAGRHWRLDTALLPLMRERELPSLAALAAATARDPGGALAAATVEALLNHETSFFRDPQPFRSFVADGLGLLHRRRSDVRRLSLWSAGCATGQEAYSLAMALAGEPERWADWDIALTATDVSHDAIARARDGLYTHFEVQRGLPIAALVRHFEAEGDQWRIRPDLRRVPRFQQHNLLDDAPGGGFDAILCRNVLMYFAADRRRQVLVRLHRALAPDGVLMLGAGETLLECEAFRADPDLKGLYRPA